MQLLNLFRFVLKCRTLRCMRTLIRRAFRKSKTGTSTMDLLQPLLANYGDRVTLDLFTLPVN
jgi:hypothetical protein